MALFGVWHVLVVSGQCVPMHGTNGSMIDCMNMLVITGLDVLALV